VTARVIALRRSDGRYASGFSGNPGGRPKVIQDIRNLAREHTEVAIKALRHIAEQGQQEAARVAAASALLDRGWGRPTQPLAGDDTMPPLGISADQVQQRKERASQMIEEAFGEAEPLMGETQGNA